MSFNFKRSQISRKLIDLGLWVSRNSFYTDNSSNISCILFKQRDNSLNFKKLEIFLKLTSALQLQTIANISETNRLRTLGMVPLCRGTFLHSNSSNFSRILFHIVVFYKNSSIVSGNVSYKKTVLILVVFYLNKEITAFVS